MRQAQSLGCFGLTLWQGTDTGAEDFRDDGTVVQGQCENHGRKCQLLRCNEIVDSEELVRENHQQQHGNGAEKFHYDAADPAHETSYRVTAIAQDHVNDNSTDYRGTG